MKKNTYLFKIFFFIGIILSIVGTILFAKEEFHLSAVAFAISFLFCPGFTFILKTILNINSELEKKGGEHLDSNTIEKAKHFFNPNSLLG